MFSGFSGAEDVEQRIAQQVHRSEGEHGHREQKRDEHAHPEAPESHLV